MDTTTLALIELDVVFFGLGVLGRLAARIGRSPIPFYLIGGLCLGNGGFIQLGDIGALSHNWPARSAWSCCCAARSRVHGERVDQRPPALEDGGACSTSS